MVKSNEDPRCPVCGGKLEKKGWVDRVRKYAGGKKAWMKIECRRCTRKECGRSHRLLPAGSTPFKHYGTQLIEDIIDGQFDEESLETEDYPCGSTMGRWRQWANWLRKNADGALRSAAYRILDLSDAFLGSRESLLEKIKERIGCGWLAVVMQAMVNSGGSPIP